MKQLLQGNASCVLLVVITSFGRSLRLASPAHVAPAHIRQDKKRELVQTLVTALIACLNFGCDCQTEGGLRNLHVRQWRDVNVGCLLDTALRCLPKLHET